MARASFSRWDSALELFKSLESGWIDLNSITATAYGDIVHMRRAHADYAANLRAMLNAEALACKHPEGWVDSQMRELINA